MFKNTKQSRGFTLVEFLAVIAVLAIIVALLVVSFRNFAGYQQYNKAVADVEFLLKQTRLKAKSAENDVVHGIKFFNSSITTFEDAPYDVADVNNDVYNYNLITIEAELTDGVDEIIFDKLSGLPSATGTVTVSGVNYSASTTLEIGGAGIIK